MAEFDIEGFIADLERMGMKLTAVPLADGKFRLNQWWLPHASDHVQQIEDLWASQIGNHQARIDLLVAHLTRAIPKAATNPIETGNRKTK
jgi:hypothetical protein